MKTCIIGAGVAGLAAAIRLAVKGHEVDVFEAGPAPGGKMTELRERGFRFDMGPSVLTMPQYVDELFALAGEQAADHFRYRRLDPVFSYFFDDGTLINTPANLDALMAELVAKTTVRKADLEKFFEACRVKLELTDPVFLQRSLHKWRNYMDMATVRGVLNFHRIGAFQTMNKANTDLLRDAKVVTIFNQYASYNGSDSFQAPSTLNLIAHYELGLGAYYPEGGMNTIPTALAALAERKGVRFHFNSRVERINRKNGAVSGLHINGVDLPFDFVMANADVHTVYNRLMPDAPRPNFTLNRPLSASVIVFYWGVKGRHAQLGLHNMFMAKDQEAEYRERYGSDPLAVDPTVYLHLSCRENPSDAPPDHENWFAMISVAHNTGQDWDKLIAQARANVIAKLSKRLGVDVAAAIVSETVMDPRLMEQRTSSHLGAVFGNSSNGLMAAFLRHANFSSGIKGLYFCGGSVHPGPGIPLALLSAKIAVNEMAVG